ncbi:hypothetical protein [Streptomyces sp. KL2]|uniref:hypothetical protein n=1 Tax=Streptomyces sp. KL2 TaxID=3050126 RepID=UPI00397D0EB4
MEDVESSVKVSAKGYKKIPAALLVGRHGGVRGLVSVSPSDSWDVLYNPYIPQVRSWISQEIEKRAESISVDIGSFQGEGESGSPHTRMSVAFDEDLEEYVRLRYHVEEEALTDPVAGAYSQRRVTTVLREFSKRYPVVFGHLSYDDPDGKTELEKFLRGVQGDPASNILKSPDRLRGYSWVMVVPEEIAAGLGGADTLGGAEAFTEIESLPSGSLWLQATGDYTDYCGERVRNVWRAVRGSLIPGEPQPPRVVPGGTPTHMVVFGGD